MGATCSSTTTQKLLSTSRGKSYPKKCITSYLKFFVSVSISLSLSPPLSPKHISLSHSTWRAKVNSQGGKASAPVAFPDSDQTFSTAQEPRPAHSAGSMAPKLVEQRGRRAVSRARVAIEPQPAVAVANSHDQAVRGAIGAGDPRAVSLRPCEDALVM